MEFNITGDDLMNGYSKYISELTKENVLTSAQLSHALEKIEELQANLLEIQQRLDYANEELAQYRPEPVIQE
ncbi:hypothetical protein PQE70_gp210 [Bacillus phage vB_BanS_Nate]|uniref:Uncharacterized protein n=1 Tax=Bacillus phage vB_BanS_Nate TaxID=2894788 RepID=A0AAE8YW61_9CAUD|nr:hypothetical protein PQE70_gp210 [Bacillus phage vB_BanS_Nate]UGO51063.1 hypothetical protein NATE_210 [Bacillus phage vB_BanS_Nate]